MDQVYQAGFFWDSPLMKSKNRFNFTVAKASNEKLKLFCKNDFNKRGGALGNVECFLQGEIKEKPKAALPLAQPVFQISQETQIQKEEEVIQVSDPLQVDAPEMPPTTNESVAIPEVVVIAN